MIHDDAPVERESWFTVDVKNASFWKTQAPTRGERKTHGKRIRDTNISKNFRDRRTDGPGATEKNKEDETDLAYNIVEMSQQKTIKIHWGFKNVEVSGKR